MFDWVHDLHILSIVAYIPLLGALAIVFFMRRANDVAVRNFATAVAAIDLLVSLPLWFAFDRGGELFQFRESHAWIPSIGVRYEFGIDGIALLLILLTTLLGFISFVSSWSAITTRQKEYYVFLLLLQTGMLGVFVALDFFLFYVFWEVMLVPMYFLIGIWGGAAQAVRRDQVLPLHAGRLGADAARHPGALLLQPARPVRLQAWATRPPSRSSSSTRSAR